MNASSLFAPVNLAEATYLSGLSRRDIDRVIDERIVPDAMIASGGVRMIAAAACALARFYFETAATLTAATRRRIVADLGERMLALRANPAGKRVDLARLTFDEGVIHVEFAGFLRDVIDARKRLGRAEKLIVSDDDILGGEPVFRGTRVPVRQAAAALAAGESGRSVLAAYPSITLAMIDAAPIWAHAHPARGRPPGVADVIAGATLTSRCTVQRRGG